MGVELLSRAVSRTPSRVPSRGPADGLGNIITSIFADGTDGFYFDFSKTDRLFQATTGGAAANDPGENIGLALDWHAGRRGVVNLLTFSEQIDNAAWPKVNVTIGANSAVAPDGTTTADLMYPTTTGTQRRLLRNLSSFGLNGAYTHSVYVKSAGWQWVHLNAIDASSNADSVWFDIINGVKGQVGADATTASIEAVGNGWFRISVSGTAGLNNYFLVSLDDSNGDITHTATANGTSGIYIWGAQTEAGSALSAYQANTGTVGGPGNHGSQSTTAAQPKYQTGGLARFDGTDDNLLTTLAPGASTSYVVKFLTSTANRTILGSRATTDTRSWLQIDLNGRFSAGVGAQPNGTIVGGSDVRGAITVGALVYDGAAVKLYVNGAEVYSAAQSGTPTTTQAMTVGCANDNGVTSSFFAGDIYHALAIKKALTAAQIASITNLWGTS